MVAFESKTGRWSGKTRIYVRKYALNYNAIMAVENIHKVFMFDHQNQFQCGFYFNSPIGLSLTPLYSFYLGL